MGGGPVTWRGSRFDPRTVAMLEEAERLWGHRIAPSQGGYNKGGVAASAGSHDGGGAVDIITRGMPAERRDRLIAALRRVGFAAWYRDAGFSAPHVHGIAVQPGGRNDRGVLADLAHRQVGSYLDGRDGLRGNGPDPHRGMRQWAGTTWEQYLRDNYAPQPEPDEQEDDDMAVWAVNVGDGYWFTDLATYRCGVTEIAVVDEGVKLGAVKLFAGGAAVGPGWVAHIMRLPRSDEA